MREPEDEGRRERQKLLQSIGIWVATFVALGGVLFTLGFFVGRASGGTQLEVYVQNPEGAYLRAETAVPASGTETTLPGQQMTTTTATAATTTVTQASMTTTPVPTTSTEITTESTQAPTETTATTATAAVTATAAGKVNINTATEAQLDTLPGIGPAKAKSIVAYREANGAFASIEDLIRVNGIGEKTMADLRPLITVGD